MIKDTQFRGKGMVRNEIRYNLKSHKDQNKATLISAVFRFGGGRLVYSTQQKIEPRNWDSKRQAPKTAYTFYSEVVEAMSSVKDAILETYSKYPNCTLGEFKEHLNILLERVVITIEPSNTVLGFINQYITRHEKLQDKAPRTFQKYRTVYNRLTDYSVHIGQDLDWSNFNSNWKDDYSHYLYHNTKVNSRTTVQKELRTLKIFLKSAYKAKVNKYNEFEDSDFMEQRAKTFHIALTESDVEAIKKVQIEDKELQTVRDWFLVACWSGLRISDFMYMGETNFTTIEGSDFLRFITDKTTTEVFIPVTPELKAILHKYNFTSPDIYSQRFNDLIKSVADKAKLHYPILLVEDVKGKPVNKHYRRCDKISSHDGRRHWATTMYMNSYPIALLMQVTGHSKESTFMTYIGIDNKSKALRLAKMMQDNSDSAKILNIKQV